MEDYLILKNLQTKPNQTKPTVFFYSAIFKELELNQLPNIGEDMAMISPPFN
jgi:hypothetical protein